jgi:hypothetical protein
MDWGAIWNAFRSGIVFGIIVIVGLAVVLVIYYLTVGSKKPEQIKVAKRRAKQLIEVGEIPDERTYEYIRYLFSQAQNDPETIVLMAGIDKLKSEGKIKKR